MRFGGLDAYVPIGPRGRAVGEVAAVRYWRFAGGIPQPYVHRFAASARPLLIEGGGSKPGRAIEPIGRLEAIELADGRVIVAGAWLIAERSINVARLAFDTPADLSCDLPIDRDAWIVDDPKEKTR